MSDKLNIEELFRSNLNSLEADVNPNAWNNIQQGLQAQAAVGTAVAAKAGLSILVKSIIIGGGIVAATVAGVYLFNNNENQGDSNESIVAVDDNQLTADDQTKPLTDQLNSVTDIVDNVQGDGSENGDQNDINPINNQNINSDPHNPITAPTLGPVPEYNNNNGAVNEETETAGGGSTPEEVVSGITQADQKPEEAQKMVKTDLKVVALHGEFTKAFLFESNAENCTKVTWDFGDGTTGEGFNIEHTYDIPGNYVVVVTASEGRQNRRSTTKLEVKSIASIGDVPNIFTPNENPENNHYFITSENLDQLSFRISDKLGRIVYTSTDINFQWDGTDFSGNIVPAGVYQYELAAVGVDGAVFPRRGTITVVR